MNQVEKAISMDGCVYCWAGVTCHFPAIRGGIPPECRACGWNPAVEPARKESARERLRREGGRNNDQS